MTNKLTLAFQNMGGTNFNATDVTVEHGDDPAFSPSNQLSAGSKSTMTAEQSNNASPGAEGKFIWSGPQETPNVEVSYHFPAGGVPQTITVTLAPEGSVQVSFDGTNFSSDEIESTTQSSSNTATVFCYLK